MAIFAGTPASAPGGVPLADVRFVVAYGQNIPTSAAQSQPLFAQAVADGYTTLVGIQTVGAAQGLRNLGVAVFQRPPPPPP